MDGVVVVLYVSYLAILTEFSGEAERNEGGRGGEKEGRETKLEDSSHLPSLREMRAHLFPVLNLLAFRCKGKREKAGITFSAWRALHFKSRKPKQLRTVSNTSPFVSRARFLLTIGMTNQLDLTDPTLQFKFGAG